MRHVKIRLEAQYVIQQQYRIEDMYNIYPNPSISPTASLLNSLQIFHNTLKYVSIAGMRVHSSGRVLANRELNFMLRFDTSGRRVRHLHRGHAPIWSIRIKFQPLLKENETYLRQSRARKSHSLRQVPQLVVSSSIPDVAYIIIGRDVLRPEDRGVEFCLVVRSRTRDYTTFDAEGGAVAAEVAGYEFNFAVVEDEGDRGGNEDEGSSGKVAAGSCSL